MPRVSVIVPCYNHARYLTERLGSIFSQTWRDFEVILLDDCSTDGSQDILSAYRGHPKVSKVLFNEENGGSAFRQWGKGIAASSGSLIWIAESDDSCEPNFLETLVAEFDRDSRCVLAYCGAMTVDGDGGKTGLYKFHAQERRGFHLSGRKFIRTRLAYHNVVVNASGALFSREAFRKAGDSFMEYRSSGDWLLWAEIAAQGNVSYVHEPLNLFRQYQGNSSAVYRSDGTAMREAPVLFEAMRREGLISRRRFFKIKSCTVFRLLRKEKTAQVTEDEVFAMWGGANTRFVRYAVAQVCQAENMW